MNRELTDDDVADFEARIEEQDITDQLRQQFFALDEYGQRRMAVDPEYRRLVETAIQAACELRRSVNGVTPERVQFEPRREPTKAERDAWERMYFATDPKTGRRLMEDQAYAAKCQELGNRTFGTVRRDASGRVMG